MIRTPPERIYISVGDLAILHGKSKTWACNEMKYLRAVLGKTKIKPPTGSAFYARWQPITIKEYSEFLNVNERTIREQLNKR